MINEFSRGEGLLTGGLIVTLLGWAVQWRGPEFIGIGGWLVVALGLGLAVWGATLMGGLAARRWWRWQRWTRHRR